LAILDQIDGNAHGRVTLATQSDFKRIVHRHRFSGISEMQTRMLVCLELFQLCAKQVRRADQYQFGFRLAVHKSNGGRNSDRWAMITTHAVYRNFNCHRIDSGRSPATHYGPEIRLDQNDAMRWISVQKTAQMMYSKRRFFA